MSEAHVISLEEQARRLNMCHDAGLELIYKDKKFKIHWRLSGGGILPDEVEYHYDFLVLRPGETVNSFTIEN